MKKLRFAFAGIRHAHIADLWTRAQEHPDIEVVACCEEDVKNSLLESLKITATHHDFAEMLSEAEFDVLAIGDYYGKRGRLAVAGLEAGKHIIADKPLCTSLEELDRIGKLAREKNLKVGLMLDIRANGNVLALREVIRSGKIGEVVTASIAGQHPLNIGVRPGWYFEKGKHGGTLNDITIHAMDFIPWMTGLAWKRIVGARTWNAKAKEFPHFQDSGQFLLELANGAGVIGDVSYLAPKGTGFSSDIYWKIIVHGTSGVAETSYNAKGVRLATEEDKEWRQIAPAEPTQGQYLEDFLADVAGQPMKDGLATENVLTSSRWALELEKAGS
jgi:predicted dehydrogenase